LTGSLTSQVLGLQKEVSTSNTTIAKYEAKNIEQVKREANLIQVQEDLKKQIKREEVDIWIKVGATAVVSFLVGRGLSK